MEDARIWNFESDLWTGGEDVYRERVSDDCVMALPATPYIFDGKAATKAVAGTPRWESVEFRNQRVERPQEGLIVIAYRAHAKRGEEEYHALCTSTLRRLSHEDWDVVQHSQIPLGVEVADPDLN
ncbi:hypothetical protein GCM10011371_20160 [Novosphingobium marinum]|uniref:DUF4440 domain-containing protein n=1 Tax=Novosphingobium marinum TaxID=1514948 RepID=A0A7Y9XZG6_9SPHN|nr:DUF4440 domain-containing protein [Novosphingobium marinum]NYH96128.1 hypothetical protein [Novosphingobium marinum]GGC32701.1 hypothetical protein GCM10011371_20160 [Novosphingobium marinum]